MFIDVDAAGPADGGRGAAPVRGRLPQRVQPGGRVAGRLGYEQTLDQATLILANSH